MKMTIEQVAGCLDTPLEMVQRWIRQGRIPIQRSGNAFTFEREVLEDWAKNHGMLFKPTDDRPAAESNAPERLYSAMQTGGVYFDLPGNDVESALKNAVNIIPNLSEETRAEIYDRLIQREHLNSTGVGRGVAIPHPRTPLPGVSENSIIATCFMEAPLPYRSLDRLPVFVLFILLSPDSRRHLRLLSRLSFCLRNEAFTRFLKTRPDPENLLSQVQICEDMLDAEKTR